MLAVAQDNAADERKIYKREGPYKLLDSSAIQEQMEYARALAGDELNLVENQRGQCNDFDESFTLWNRPKWVDDNAVPTQVFDNVYYVGVKAVGGWVFDTGDGYIMLDSNYEGEYDTLIQNFEALGLDPADVKYIMITHSGPDHIGALPAWTSDYPNVKIYTDTDTARRIVELGTPEESLIIVTEVESSFTLGDTEVSAVITPRRFGGGGLSFIVPVWVDGKRHTLASFGNTGAPGTLEEKALWMESISLFQTYVDKYRADIALSSHPFVDASIDYMEMIRKCNDKPGQNNRWNNKGRNKGQNEQKCRKNPLVIGQDATRRYFEIFYQCGVVQTMRQEEGLDKHGLSCLKGYELNADTGKCTEIASCDPGYELVNNVCVEECGEGYTRDSRTGECVEM